MLKTTFELKYPVEKTYWIFWTNKTTDFVYGSTESQQVTDTGQPNFWTTTSEAEWLYKLKTEFKTIPNEP